MIKRHLIFLFAFGFLGSVHAQTSHYSNCACVSCSLAEKYSGSEISTITDDPTFSPSNGHLLDFRWDRTATGGLVPGNLGDATTLTWGLVPDGTVLPTGNVSGESNNPSSLISFLDLNLGSGGGGSDYTNRPWFSLFQSSYNRWGELSGLSFVYESSDDGAAVPGNTGSLGVRADMRVGGHSIDGQIGGNVLAYNYFPNNGDMVIDTDNSNLFTNATNNYRGVRNLLMHEIGHGLGFRHPVSSNEQFLMEPFLSTAFDGPQHSDVLAVQRGYGDKFEAGSGNDTSANATALGDVSSFSGIGFDGDNADVAATDVDFVSIDGSTDTDFYSITTSQDGTLDIALDALGLQYQIEEQSGANATNVDTSALNDLALALFGSDGSTLLASSDVNGLGGSESIVGQFLSANTYFIRVTGNNDAAQFYSLSTTFLPAAEPPVSPVPVPEPSHVALLAVSFAGLLVRRRR